MSCQSPAVRQVAAPALSLPESPTYHRRITDDSVARISGSDCAGTGARDSYLPRWSASHAVHTQDARPPQLSGTHASPQAATCTGYQRQNSQPRSPADVSGSPDPDGVFGKLVFCPAHLNLVGNFRVADQKVVFVDEVQEVMSGALGQPCG